MKATNNKEYIDYMRKVYGDEFADCLFKKWGYYVSYDLCPAYIELCTEVNPNITFKYDSKIEATEALIENIKMIKRKFNKEANLKIKELKEK